MPIETYFIGQTGRNLITRLSNHNIDSPFQQESDVAKYEVDNPTHKIGLYSCTILGFSNNWQKRLIKVLLCTQKFNLSTNSDKQFISLLLFYTYYV